MSGGFTPGLRREDDGLGLDYEAAFLASEHHMQKRGGITIDASTVGADANGDKILSAGTVLAKVDSTGKYRAYDNAQAANAGGVASGFLLESVNLRDGDVITGLMIHGSVIEARTSGLDSAAKTDLAGRIVFQ